jgi:uncharacterized surface protein with fasciclin (FAS1) repeats
MKNAIVFAVALVGLLNGEALLAQCGSNNAHHAKTTSNLKSSKPGKGVVDLALGNEQFSTLVTALSAAKLVDALKGEGPFTVFAPTNAAFDKLPNGTVENLLRSENQKALGNILTYHVIAGSFDSKTLLNAIENNGGSLQLKSLNGGKIKASILGQQVCLTDERGNRAMINMADLRADNGYIHVIDTVVLPRG